MKQVAKMRNTLCTKTKLVTILLIWITIGTAKAGNNMTALLAKGSTISYTMHVGTELITCNSFLNDDSYMFADSECSIVIADPKERFHIGIIKKGAIAAGNKFGIAGKDEYVQANFLVYDDKSKTMQAIPFDTGYTQIEVNGSGSYRVHFFYTMKEAGTGKLVTLKGTAVFAAHSIAMH